MGYIHTVEEVDHTVTDSDSSFRFIIDPVTRQITNQTGKTVLTKLDHNSECFTFEIPATIEGHDMSTCNVVEVHYINIESSTRATKEGVYPIEDFVKDEEKNVWTFSWLVSQNATQYAGMLNFAVRFACFKDGQADPDYSWRTGVFSGITVIDSVFSEEQAIVDYSDILQSWWNKIESTHEEVYVITDEGAINSLTKAIEYLETNVSGLKEVDTNLNVRVGTLETDVSGLKEVDTNLSGRVGTLETDVSGLKEVDTNLSGRVGTLETDVSGLKEVDTNLNGRLAILEETAVPNLQAADTALSGRLATLEETRTTLYRHMISLYDPDDTDAQSGYLFIVTNGATAFTVKHNSSTNNYEIEMGEDSTFIFSARWYNNIDVCTFSLLLNTTVDDLVPDLMNVGYLTRGGIFVPVTMSDFLNENSTDIVTKL